MIVRWPGETQPGRMSSVPGHVIDVMPTLLEIAVIEYPTIYKENGILQAEGSSLMLVLRGDAEMNRDMLFWEYRGSRTVRDGKWKM